MGDRLARAHFHAACLHAERPSAALISSSEERPNSVTI